MSEESKRRAQFFQAVELTTATYDAMARDYAERNAMRPPEWSERMERFVELLAEAERRRPIPELGRPGDDITLEEYLNFTPALDAGCGPGRDTRALANYGLPVLGVDLSQGMLDEAGERTARRLERGFIRYALMDLRRLELPDACCRGVWCSASLLHLPKRVAPRAMGELARVTRSGGPLVVFLKGLRPGHEDEREAFIPYSTDQAEARRFFAYYTPDEAQALLEGAGLRLLDAATFPDPRAAENPPWIALVAQKP